MDSGNCVRVEDSSSVKFTWKIENFSKLSNKSYSDVFNAYGHKWRILINPKGNAEDHMSMYLDVADSATLPSGWSIYAKYRLSVVNKVDKCSVGKETEHTFNKDEADWGFTSMIPLSLLNDLDEGYLVDDTCTVRAEIMREVKQEKEEEKTNENAVLNKAGKCSSSISKFDIVFDDILDVQTLEMQKNQKNFCVKQIRNAEKILKQCLDMDLNCIIQTGKAIELKNSLSVVLSTNTFSDNLVDEATKIILGDYDQSLDNYEAALRDLSEAKENENSVTTLKTNLEQLVSRFVPLRNEAEAIDREIDRLEKQTNDRKERKARLMKRVEDLAGQATTSKQALDRAEQTMKLFMLQTEQAEKTVSNFERSWQSLKELYTMTQTDQKAQP